MTGKLECFDRAQSIIRLSGDSLPEWCAEPTCGGLYAWATAFIAADGVLWIHPAQPPATAATPSMYEKILENYSNKN
jgi:hypothetical protein